ncbi:hypothetical protein [Ornithinibacillus californiensis]|uniref:hypothetical protein n=1 Tax=Ornithinibacillus californiensis TaxID=161536 RepID=UPI00064E0C05|nr:hypothetical protein [Ornithinibacillus californiensis]
MNDKQQFIALLKVAKRKLFLKHVTKQIYNGMLGLGLFTLLLIIAARIVVITHLVDKIIIFSLIIAIGVIVLSIVKGPSKVSAADYYDLFVTEDRIKTSLHYIDDTSMMSQLQRRDTISKMTEALPALQAKKIKIIHGMPLVLLGLFLFLSITLYYLPNETMKLAVEKEKEEKIVEETKDDIEELAKDDQTEKLKEFEETTKELKESKELLEELLKEEAKLEQEKQIAEDNEKKLKEIAQETKALEKLSEALESLDASKLDEAIKDLLEQKLSSLTAEEKKALEDLIASVLNDSSAKLDELTDEQLDELVAALEEELNTLMESAISFNNLLALQEQIQDIASSLQQNMSNIGLSDSNQLAFGNQNQSGQQSQNGNQSNSGQNGAPNEGGQNPSEGNGDGNGGSDGSGNGSGDGSGTGNGSGSGTGSGSGSGGTGSGGAGAGFGQGSRELTIPEKIEGNDMIEEDFGEFAEGSSEFQTTPEGLVIKGSVRSYEEVYGDYASSYRNSVERLELPAYLEDVVKDYFSDLDPEGE